MTTAFTLATADVLDAKCILTTDDTWAHVSDRVVVLCYSYRVPTDIDNYPASNQFTSDE